MSLADEKYFDLLKKDISEKLRQSHPGVDEDLSRWKGDEISRFQDDLIEKANGRISEKWFYTHIKKSNGHLPRIDILNLLCRYVGFDDWNGYKGSKKDYFHDNGHRRSPKWSPVAIWTTLAIIAFLSLLIMIQGRSNSFSFHFVNAWTRQSLTGDDIEVIILHETESPRRLYPDSGGRLKFSCKNDVVRMVVKGPYYQTDTVTRIHFRSRQQETIPVKVNDYAVMLHLFSRNAVDDWSKKRQQIDSMLSDNVQIFQVVEGEMIGMEMYNKEEFINKLTMPLNSLKNIEVIEMVFEGKKIKELRFKQHK